MIREIDAANHTTLYVLTKAAASDVGCTRDRCCVFRQKITMSNSALQSHVNDVIMIQTNHTYIGYVYIDKAPMDLACIRATSNRDPKLTHWFADADSRKSTSNFAEVVLGRRRTSDQVQARADKQPHRTQLSGSGHN